MKKLSAILPCTLVLISCCFAQPVFQKAFYVPGNFLKASDVMHTADNNLLFTASYSSRNQPIGRGVLLKTDLDGNEIWTYTCDCGLVGGLNAVMELQHSYYAIGTVNTGSTNFISVLVKIDSAGNMLWSKRISFDNYTLACYRHRHT